MRSICQSKPVMKNILNTVTAADRAMSADLMKLDGKSIKTFNGADLKASAYGGVTYNGNVHDTKMDNDRGKGLIHAIDMVPPQSDT